MSRGKLPAVWLGSPAACSWAAIHVSRRHKARIEDVIVLEVSVPRSWLRRSRKRLRYSLRDIPATRISRHVIAFSELASVCQD
jgi:hypothetical protein